MVTDMKGYIRNKLSVLTLLLMTIPFVTGCYTQLQTYERSYQEEQSSETYYDGRNSGFEYRDYQTYRFWNPTWMHLRPYSFSSWSIDLQWAYFHNPDLYYAGWYGNWYPYSYYWRDHLYYAPYRYYAGNYYWPYRYRTFKHFDYGDAVVRVSGMDHLRFDALNLDYAGLDRLGRIDRYRTNSSFSDRIRNARSSFQFNSDFDRPTQVRKSGTRVRSSGSSGSGNRSSGNSSGSGSSGRTDRSRSDNN
jgi:uncharacterized membrane protein YgcG